jgi:hypothetical protein
VPVDHRCYQGLRQRQVLAGRLDPGAGPGTRDVLEGRQEPARKVFDITGLTDRFTIR